jgi:regulatory protein
MRHELARRGLAAEQQQEILQRLAERGLLDDGAFAAAWVENRMAFRPRSAAGLRFELRRKGIAPSAIDEALHGYDEETAASAALQRMVRRWKGLPAEDFRRRAQDYLVRRGFTVAAARLAARACSPGAVPAQSEETL